MIAPKAEYQSRLSEWSRRAQAHERAHLRMGNLRLLFVVGLVILAAVLVQTRVVLGIVLTIVLFGLFLTGMVHDRILKARDRARRAMGFYQAGLNRLDGSWAGKSSPGTEFLDPHHPYASDLDLFGAGSLFELLNTTQTESGRATLAAWLLAPAAPEEIRARQEAVDELRPKVDLREGLGLIAAEAQAWIRTEALIAWAGQARVLESNFVRVAAFCLPLASLALYLSGLWALSLAVLAGQFALARYWGGRVHQVVREAGVAPGDLEWLAEVLRCLENQPFQRERLRRMEAESECDGISASQAIQRLGKLYAWMVSGETELNIISVIANRPDSYKLHCIIVIIILLEKSFSGVSSAWQKPTWIVQNWFCSEIRSSSALIRCPRCNTYRFVRQAELEQPRMTRL